MTKAQMIKQSRELIVNSGKSHQQTFDELKGENTSNLKVLADIISAVPSDGKLKENATLKYIFAGLLMVIVILRLLTFASMALTEGLNTPLFIVLLVFGLFVPAYGLYAVFSDRVQNLYTVGVLIGLSIIRSFGRSGLGLDPLSIIIIVLMVATVVLAFYYPHRLKTPYSTTFSTNNENGTNQYITEYQFEDTRIKREDVLDNRI